ncbi:MAG: glutathione peroxidase [Proteobacteria bacterium]|nr:MAG: glutathione peroxidase [Pseudomonadota bacterium]
MKANSLNLLAFAALLLVSGSALAAGLLDQSYRPLAGKDAVNLNKTYGGEVILVVNTASKCGFTPQYDGLEALQKKYSAQGFTVLGFPSNDFMGQEPGTEAQIKEFCTLTYGVKFPMFEKVHVKGKEATPLYRELAKATGVEPGWNFHKYLLARDGRVVANFSSKVKPDDAALVTAIERELKAAKPAN